MVHPDHLPARTARSGNRPPVPGRPPRLSHPAGPTPGADRGSRAAAAAYGPGVPLAGMLVKKPLAAATAFFQHRRHGRQVGAVFRQLSEPPLEGRTDGRKEGVHPRRPGSSSRYPDASPTGSGLGQDLQVPGNPRLPHPKDTGQLLHGEFAAQEHRHQTEPGRVGQGL